MTSKDLRVGIIATGWIAEKAALTIQQLEGETSAIGYHTKKFGYGI